MSDHRNHFSSGSDILIIEREYDPVGLAELPRRTSLPIVLPRWWGADDIAVQWAELTRF